MRRWSGVQGSCFPPASLIVRALLPSVDTSEDTTDTDSKVFRDMIEICDPNAPQVIELNDSVIETAEVVTAVLDQIIDNKTSLDLILQLHNPIICFIQKYDCERELYHMRCSIGLATTEGRNPMRAFIAAARIGAIQLCGRAIAEAGSVKWIKVVGHERFGFRGFGGPIFEVGAIPLRYMECLAPPVLWALVCASCKRTGLEENIEQDNEAMSEEFMRLMQLKGEFRVTVGL
jgi:hypothetical protein